MGSYGVGLARVLRDRVEQRHDDAGIRWPRSLAPYDVHVVALPGVEREAVEAAERLSAAAPRCCSTTVTAARARSSPTRTWSGCRCV